MEYEEIEWLNSLDIPSCSLVTSSEDLKSGVVLCDVVAFIKSRPPFEEVLRHGSVHKNFKQSAIHNFHILLQEIGTKLPPSLVHSAEDFLESNELLIEIVRFLQGLFKPHAKPSPLRLPRNKTPVSRISGSPTRLPQRLQHSPSMIDIRIHSKPQRVKEEIFEWLQGLKIIKTDVIEEVKDGVALCDLINRLEGKSEVIKGMHRAPKNRSAAQVNIFKALGFLRSIEKFNSKYLWSQTEILEGDDEAIWGLLSDIKEFYNRKRQVSKNSKSPRALTSRTYSENFSESDNDHSNTKLLLKRLGVQYPTSFESRSFLQDNTRNGLLLYEVLSKLEGTEIPGVVIPKTLTQAQQNIETCLKFIYAKHPAISVKYLQKLNNLIQGGDTMWDLLHEILNAPRSSSNIKSELPYSPEEIFSLQSSLLRWTARQIGISYDSFDQLVAEVSEGNLLGDLIEKCGIHVIGLIKNPKTSKTRENNIAKCLESLRKSSRMSQQGLWKIEEIKNGNSSIILGLLEDLHRFADGLAPRKRGPLYYSDGPYLGSSFRSRSKSPLNSPPSLVLNSYKTHEIFPKATLDIESPNEFDWVFLIGVTMPDFDICSKSIEEFRTGVLLCNLVERLERKVITGIENKPKSNAVALHNVVKAMRVLKSKPTFPSNLMFIDEEIVKGNGDAIRNLLRAMQKIYKNTIKSHMKFHTEKMNITYFD